MVLETYMKLCLTELDFLEKVFFATKIRKMDQKWAKNRGFFYLLKNLILLNLFCNENLYYLLCSLTNPIFWKIFVP